MTTRFDLPVVDNDTLAWWDGVRDGRLLLERCCRCGTIASYPRTFCSACWSDDVEWLESSGVGVIYTYTVVRANDLSPFAERLPYVVAMIELDEGPRIMAGLAEVAPDDVKIGTRVSFRPRELDERWSALEFVPQVGA